LPIVPLVEVDLDAAVPNTGHNTARKLPNVAEEFHPCIEQNKRFIPNYGERYRVGERISTGFVESTMNRVVRKLFCKRQQMPWRKRAAHLLLQTRVKILSCELGSVVRRWYPDSPVEEDEDQAA
jgi:hypothetical protein